MTRHWKYLLVAAFSVAGNLPVWGAESNCEEPLPLRELVSEGCLDDPFFRANEARGFWLEQVFSRGDKEECIERIEVWLPRTFVLPAGPAGHPGLIRLRAGDEVHAVELIEAGWVTALRHVPAGEPSVSYLYVRSINNETAGIEFVRILRVAPKSLETVALYISPDDAMRFVFTGRIRKIRMGGSIASPACFAPETEGDAVNLSTRHASRYGEATVEIRVPRKASSAGWEGSALINISASGTVTYERSREISQLNRISAVWSYLTGYGDVFVYIEQRKDGYDEERFVSIVRFSEDPENELEMTYAAESGRWIDLER